MTDEGMSTIGYALLLMGAMFGVFGGLSAATAGVKGAWRLAVLGLVLLIAGFWLALKYGIEAA